MRTALFWVVTQRIVVISYRRFGTTYRSHIHVSRIFSILETWVRNDHYSLRNNPEERSYLLNHSAFPQTAYHFVWLIFPYMSFFFFLFFLSLTFFYLVTVDAESYCCTWWRSVTHTLGRTPLDEWSARLRGLYLHNTQHTQQTEISVTWQGSNPQYQQASARRPKP